MTALDCLSNCAASAFSYASFSASSFGGAGSPSVKAAGGGIPKFGMIKLGSDCAGRAGCALGAAVVTAGAAATCTGAATGTAVVVGATGVYMDVIGTEYIDCAIGAVATMEVI